MYRDDFILRHIRLFVMAIAKALGLIDSGDLGLALETVRVSFIDLLGMSLDDFLAYPDDRLKEFLYFGELGPMGLNRAAFAASMLTAAGRIYAGMEKPEKRRVCDEKALRVILETILGEEETVEFPEFAPPVNSILADLPLTEIGDDLLTMLVFYFDRTGELGRADLAIRTLLARRPDDPDTTAVAKSFYEYLLEEDVERLRERGLPLEKVRQALEGLDDRFMNQGEGLARAK